MPGNALGAAVLPLFPIVTPSTEGLTGAAGKSPAGGNCGNIIARATRMLLDDPSVFAGALSLGCALRPEGGGAVAIFASCGCGGRPAVSTGIGKTVSGF